MSVAAPAQWQRRARPLLGTLVEIGLKVDATARAHRIEDAFNVICHVQACLSRFEPDSDITRFHKLPRGASLKMRPDTVEVLTAASELRQATDAIFDISVGTSPHGWCIDGDTLVKHDDAVRLDLGGIGKGYAVDCAVRSLLASGATAGWVNAGGDLRAFGHVDLPVHLRNEDSGGLKPFASLRDGAMATSVLDCESRERGGTGHKPGPKREHVSVAAPLCLWADALTKVVAATGDRDGPLLARYGALAWRH